MMSSVTRERVKELSGKMSSGNCGAGNLVEGNLTFS